MQRFKMTASIEDHLEPTDFTVYAEDEAAARQQIAEAARRRVRRRGLRVDPADPTAEAQKVAFEADLPEPEITPVVA